MSNVLIAIADPARAPLRPALVAELGRRFDAEPRWLAAEEAAEFPVEGDPARIRAAALEAVAPVSDLAAIDLAVVPAANRRKRLLISDMDSTMITVECIDELADFAGVKSEVAAITSRAMAGELDFAGALRERVGLLEGLPVDVIDQVFAERVRMMPGARILVQTMIGFGAVTALVSGGFVPFAERVASALGFGEMVANRLETANGRLTGKVLAPITGPDVKRSTLQRLIRLHGLRPDETLAVGDGANDLPMIMAAGLGVAFRAHAPVAEASEIAIQAADLTALLYLQGVPKAEFFID
jgi:phosphoserine phosphatase